VSEIDWNIEIWIGVPFDYINALFKLFKFDSGNSLVPIIGISYRIRYFLKIRTDLYRFSPFSPICTDFCHFRRFLLRIGPDFLPFLKFRHFLLRIGPDFWPFLKCTDCSKCSSGNPDLTDIRVLLLKILMYQHCSWKVI